jgi:hypothetical protein
LDPDLGWHLKVGQGILQTGLVPNINQYNYTFTGSWVDHEWLSNLILYFLYSHGGYIVVSLVFALLIVGVLILLNIIAQRRQSSSSFIAIIIFQVLGVVACLPHFGARIQEIGLLFLLLLLLLIDYYNQHESWLILWLLPPLMYFWACLHASFLIGFFLLGAWVLVKLGEKLIGRYQPRPWLDMSKVISYRKMTIFVGASLLALAVTTLTPYRLKLYEFLAGYQDNFYQAHIQEWLSQFSFPFQYWQLFYLVLVVLAVIGYVYHSWSREKYFKINLWTVFLVGLFIILSFKSRRHFPLMLVATFFFVIEIYTTVFRQMLAGRPLGRNPWRPWICFFLLLCLVLVAASELVQTRFTTDPFTAFCADYPCGAVNFLQEHPNYGPWHLFNDYGWGGFLIWTDPARLLFIDGRLPQVTFAGHSFLAEYLDFFKPGADFTHKLSQYQIRLILMPAKDKNLVAANWEKIIFGIKDQDLQSVNYLRRYLSAAPDWQPVYADATAIIYAQK